MDIEHVALSKSSCFTFPNCQKPGRLLQLEGSGPDICWSSRNPILTILRRTNQYSPGHGKRASLQAQRTRAVLRCLAFNWFGCEEGKWILNSELRRNWIMRSQTQLPIIYSRRCRKDFLKCLTRSNAELRLTLPTDAKIKNNEPTRFRTRFLHLSASIATMPKVGSAYNRKQSKYHILTTF